MIVDANIAILAGILYPLQGQSRFSWIGPMNILPRDKQVEAIAALCEGVSIRATERLTGVNRGTILSLEVRVGGGCAMLHDATMRGLHVSRIELDEAWSFVAKKQRHLKQTDPADFGDQYAFLALAGAGKSLTRNRNSCMFFVNLSISGMPSAQDGAPRAGPTPDTAMPRRCRSSPRSLLQAAGCGPARRRFARRPSAGEAGKSLWPDLVA